MKKFSNILKLLTWNNQSFPIGSYCFSSGLEFAVESKIIKTCKELQYLLKDLLKYGSLHSDALILLEAWELANKKEKGNIMAKLRSIKINEFVREIINIESLIKVM